MENINEHIDDLLLKYKNGNISDDEVEELLEWIEQNNENRDYFKEQMKFVGLYKSKDINFDAVSGIKSIFNKNQNKKHFPLISGWWAYAASILVLISIGFLVLYSESDSDSEKPVLSYSSNNKVIFFTLSDSSEVSLSKSSVLTAFEKFETDERLVGLKGKAFFKVKKDPERPFIVKAGNIEVKVLGTCFEVENDTVQNIVKIAVSEGKVLVQHQDMKVSKILKPNDQISITQEGKLIEEIVLENENHLAWKTGILTFSNAPMKEVVKDLSRLYDKVFYFGNPEIESYSLTTKIDKQSLEEVKIILEKTLDLKIQEQNDTIFLLLP